MYGKKRIIGFSCLLHIYLFFLNVRPPNKMNRISAATDPRLSNLISNHSPCILLFIILIGIFYLNILTF